MKIIVTTSDGYVNHIVPIFCHLFNVYWSKDQQVEIVGYKAPEKELPSNFTFHSLGEQVGSNKNFSNDLIPYFDRQDRRFIWMFEDTFVREVKRDKLSLAQRYSVKADVGRFSLTNNSLNQYSLIHGEIDGEQVNMLPDKSEYRISTMPAIWKKDFLLQYLSKDMNPWEFECQDKVSDNWAVVAFNRDSTPLISNEGVRKRDIFDYNFEGIDPLVIEEMKQLRLI